MNKLFDKLKNRSLGILLIRIAVGGVFLVHGIGKLSNMEGTVSFFQDLGLNSLIAWSVALVETIGGLAVILGLWTQLASIGLLVITVGIFFTAKWGRPIMSSQLELTLLFSSLALIFTGGGKYALQSRKCSNCGTCSCVCHPGDQRCGPEGTCVECGCK